MKLQFIVYGDPVGKERPRKGKWGHFYTPTKTKKYQKQIGLNYIVIHRGKKFPEETKIYLDLKIYFRSKIHPDADNVFKLVADALEGVAYKNDKYIVGSCDYDFDNKVPRIIIALGDEQ